LVRPLSAPKPYIEVGPFLAEASRIAGADDWGDEGFLEPFEVFVDALNAEAELTAQGLARTRSHIMKLLVGRLRLYRDRKAYEGIARQEIRAPLVLTGHGRSGTSYLNALLASDPANLAPRHWQIWTLSPPPALPSTDNGPQIAAGEHYIRFEGWQDPEVRRCHDYSNLGAAEDTLIMEYSFINGSFPFFWNVPSYGVWLQAADPSPAYRIERHVLQALQYGQANDRWVLKSPLHLGQLDHLFAEFPDARLVVNHRDPVKTLASIVGLLHGHRKQFGNPPPVVDRAYALAAMEGAARSAEALIRRRSDPATQKAFVDINYVELEDDPLGQAAKVYAHYGLKLTDAARAAMARHVATNRKGKFGFNQYSIEEIGLREGEVRERFRFYTDHYDIPREAV
jgi:hypothetical protein